ncbi:hypothetical protein yc1106_05272 [Curvularia clavata]|uniref:Uncharacterized protein n=1 Tax=Curvularia clavata TaxID=95742 RepID=A0A9Q8ZC04_CURCL|nr:hypothetical protein yc1106_05272 [Curvularia clavata]
MRYIIYNRESGLEESSVSSIEVADVRTLLRCTAVASAASFCSLSREFRLPPDPRILSHESLRVSKDQCTSFAPFEDVSLASQALQAPAQSITLLNAPLVLIGQGPYSQIISGFTDIISTATTALVQMQGMLPVAAGADSDAIFDAFREIVRVHQTLLNILIGKAGLVESLPVVGTPVAAVLRQDENVVDTLAFTLIHTVQSRATDLQSEANYLSQTLSLAIQKYVGLVQLKKRSLRFGACAVTVAA